MVVQECGAALRNVTTAKSPLNIKRDSDDDDSEIIVTSCVSFIIEQYGSKMIERSCSFSYEGVDVCDYISEIENVLMCDSCNEDKCNLRTNIQTVNVKIISDE
nr:uncharacterized protein LOC111420548 [Onthophagus taurus]